jgi:hypothetical protein
MLFSLCFSEIEVFLVNIFISDPNPHLSAIALDDRRRNKMIVESCQMLSTSLILSGASSNDLPTNSKGLPYRKSHELHPCTRWVNNSSSNYLWLAEHTRALLNAYKQHMGRSHACVKALEKLLRNSFIIQIDIGLTPFVNCATHHKHIKDVHEAYQLELIKKWNEHKEGYPPKWNGHSTFPGFSNSKV